MSLRSDQGNFIEQRLDAMVARMLEEIAAPIIADAVKQVESRLRERIGGITGEISRRMMLERFGEDLRITIKFPTPE